MPTYEILICGLCLFNLASRFLFLPTKPVAKKCSTAVSRIYDTEPKASLSKNCREKKHCIPQPKIINLLPRPSLAGEIAFAK